MHKTEFQIGPYRIIAEMSERRVKEADVAAGLGDVDSVIEGEFIFRNKLLIQTKPDYVASILQNGSPIFFLNAHGDDYNGEWCYFDGYEEDENAIPVEQKLEQIAAEGVRSAFIFSCNPNRHVIESTPIPVLYPTYSLSEEDMHDFLTVKLPNGMHLDKDKQLDIVLSYIDLLYDTEKESCPILAILEKNHRVYEKMRRCAREFFQKEGEKNEE